MTSEEKVFKILMAETDDDIYEAIGALTDAQNGKGLFAPVG